MPSYLELYTKPQPDGDLRRAGDGPRERPCIMCKTPFKSASSANRVCKKCKTSTPWKEGDSLADHVCSTAR